MHIGGLNRDQGREPLRVLDDDLRDKPRIGLGIVGLDENPSATMLLAPLGNVYDVLQVPLSRHHTDLRASGESLQSPDGRFTVVHV